MARTLEIKGFEELLKDLDRVGKLNEAVWLPVHDAVSQIVQRIETEAKENLLRNNSVAFGQLRASIGSVVEKTETEIVGRVGTNLGRPDGVEKAKGYAEPVEFGSRPHWLPASVIEPGEPLFEWVRIKQLAGFSQLSRGKMKRQSQSDQIRSIAARVRYKIAHYGTRARPYFYPAVESGTVEAQSLIERAIAKVLISLAGKK